MLLRSHSLSNWISVSRISGTAFAILAFALAMSPTSQAQLSVSGCRPLAIHPGQKTRLEVYGQNLKAPLRIGASLPIEFEVVAVEPTKATVDVTLPVGTNLGPVGLWVADDDGVCEPIQLLVDDLPSIPDNGVNHQRDQAQAVALPCAIDGQTEGGFSDFYQVHAAADSFLTLDLVAERIGSTMDGWVRIYDVAGRMIAQADDNDIGPDCRVRIKLPNEGDYWIEVCDSRFAGGGRYRLRLGDFPLGNVPFPLAVHSGVSTPITFLQPDGAPTNASDLLVPAGAVADRVSFGPVNPASPGGTWCDVLVRDMPLHAEALDPNLQTPPSSASPLPVPIGISGRLLQAKEHDTYFIQGTSGQTVRIATRTRSLGSPCLLRMQLFNPAGTKVVETAINDSDEWSMEIAFGETGVFRLDVFDLLELGGPTSAYWIEVIPSGQFAVAIKPDANTKEHRTMESSVGATAFDFQVQRFNYDGPIQLELDSPLPGLRIHNPMIAAGATEARIYLIADSQWNPSSLSAQRWIARRNDNPSSAVPVNSTALRRLKAPHQPFPPNGLDGRIALAGTAAKAPFFALDNTQPVALPKVLMQSSFSATIKRLHAEFKEPFVVLGTTAPDGWNAQATLENDALKINLTRAESMKGQPIAPNAEGNVSVMVYGQFQTGRVETLSIPVTWYDPLRLELDPLAAIVPGSVVQVNVRAQRTGPESQPVQLQCLALPPGITCPTPAILTADQQATTLQLQVAPEFSSTTPISLQVTGTSTLSGTEFQAISNTLLVAVESIPVRVEAFPPRIAITRSRDNQRVVLTGWDPNDVPRDWTPQAMWSCIDPKVAQWIDGQVHPMGNGQTELIAQVGTIRTSIPVSVENFEKEAPVEFENEVLVALSKQGCNSGACHGSPSGKGNFRLSLRAFDKQLDALTLVREDFARRINPIEPEQSLLLRKPLMKVPHGGGIQIHRSDKAFALLKDWIAQGAKLDREEQTRCVRLEVYPHGQRTLPRQLGEQQLLVTAHFSDGKTRDVTELAVFESSNTSVATVSLMGRVQPLARGESVIMVRYLEHIASVPFLFVDDIPGFEWNPLPQYNFVDTWVDDKLRQLQFAPAPICSDEVFLRRVHLDVIGLLPTVDEATRFLNDPSPDKRSRLIDSLLERPEYAKFWSMKWGDLLRMTSKSVGNEGVYKYHRWVEQSLRDNMPYNEFARQLLTASGSTYSNPAANFYRTAGDTNDCVETISQVFLGARLQCAKCHNHPFERWTQDNYYGLGAFFQRVRRKKTQRPNEWFVWTSNSGEVVQPRTGQTMKPWVPGAGELSLDEETDRRNAFADWLIRPDNPYLARVEANRIWSHLFARGIVDPIDDFRDSNPPSNKPLLDALTNSFVQSGFDRKQLIRTILHSRTYQSTFETSPFNEQDQLYFSHQQPRLLGAEQLLDAINQLTQTEQSFGTLPPGTKATQIPAPDLSKVDFLKVFGQPERSTVCACERSEDSNLSMAIELFNGATIYEKLRNPNNRFRQGIAAGKTLEQIIRDMYLAGLSRPPTDAELKEAMQHCSSKPDAVTGLEDLCWVLINTDEFLFQH